MDLIYADKNRAELGEIMDYEMDLAYGSEENDFELTVGLNLSCCQPGYMVYFRDTEYGGIIDSICPDTKEDMIIFMYPGMPMRSYAFLSKGLDWITYLP